MRSSALALLLLSLPALGQETIDVERAAIKPRLPADSPIVEVQGGYWLSDEAGKARADELVQLRAENAALREAPNMDAMRVTVVLVCVFVGGFVLGVMAHAKLGEK